MPQLSRTSLLAIDGAFLTNVARQFGLPHISPAAVRGFLGSQDFDVLETFTTLIREVPDSLDDRQVGEKQNLFAKRRHALEMAGATVIPCPSRRMEGGYKQSDDQRLVVKALSFCLRVRPRFLCLAAGDRDYIPLVEELRSEGVRTLLLTHRDFCSYDLERICWQVRQIEDGIDIDAARAEIRPETRAEPGGSPDADADALAGALFRDRDG